MGDMGLSHCVAIFRDGGYPLRNLPQFRGEVTLIHMSKSRDNKRDLKKAPKLTAKEKKQAKRLKKENKPGPSAVN